jgi:uncharacterized DUF497 family protein
MHYEWDEAKNRSNQDKHGLDFADAPLVLSGRCVTFVDDLSSMERHGLSVSARSPGAWW